MSRAAEPAQGPEFAIETRGLTKTYRPRGNAPAKTALDDVSLQISRGSLFGLLGPNGAGKSTFINILAGLVMKTGGEAHIWGINIDADPRNAKAAIGIVPQELNLDPFFTPRELLEVQAGLYGVPKAERRTDEILEMIGLSDKAEAYARTLSGGMRRRLLIGKAMVHSPPILVLDEPTAGVDIELRRQLWHNVVELNRQGVTILLTTHYLEEAEELCDRIAIINKGRVVAHDETSVLLSRLDEKALRVTTEQPLDRVPDSLAAFNPTLIAAPPERGALRLSWRPSQANAGAVLAAVQAAGLVIRDLSTEEADLEDVFLQLTRD
jgi:ABC-2 type transport system ATP-binding protein